MIEALAAIGAGSTLTLIGLVAFLAYKLVRSKDEQLAARDLLDKEREEKNHAVNDLAVETAAHAETRRLLAAEKDLRAVAESQRNQAWKESREEAVRIIESSGVADAAHLGNRILSMPLPGARLSETGDSALERP